MVAQHNPYRIMVLLLRNGESVTTPLYGPCMTPFIRNGDTVTITPVKPERLICGDIAVYQYGDRLKIHRFLGYKKVRSQTYLLTKGDKSIYTDKPVPFSLFLGKVTHIYKRNYVICMNSLYWVVFNYVFVKLNLMSDWIKTIHKRCIWFTKKVVKRTLIRLKLIDNHSRPIQ